MDPKPLAIALVLGLGLETASADTLTGAVRDGQGRPIAGARVDVATAAPKVGPAMFCPSCYSDCAKWTRTDADGKFAIDKLNPGLKFRILATATDMISAMTRLVDPASENPAITLQPIPADLPPERMLKGRVVDESGAPVAGAFVSPAGAETVERRWWGLVEGIQPSVSDADGRFLMILDRSYRGIDVEVMSAGFAGTSAPLLAPGAMPHTITVPLGARVTGRLLDAGKPAAGVQVAVVQLERGAFGHFIKAVGSTTGNSGDFAFEHLPASQRYALFSNVSSNPPSSPVVETRTFTVPADGDSRDLGTLPARAPLSLSGRIVMPDGAKVSPEARVSLGRDPAWDLIATSVAEDGTFSFAPLPPEAYVVSVVAKGFELDISGLQYQPLGATSFGIRVEESIANLTIPMKHRGPVPSNAHAAAQDADDADSNKALAEFERGLEKPASVTLVGRVLKDGRPRPGVTMSLYRSISGSSGSYGARPFAEVKTDGLGRYAVHGLAAGDGYYFKVHPGDASDDSGWNHQYPYLQVLRPLTAGFVRLPDIRLIDRDQSLSGIVVDPRGNPVSGVTVSARIADTFTFISQPEGAPPWMETDAQGRFDLRKLPNLPIELMAYVRTPKGGRILRPAIVRPGRDRSDVRILFDPALAVRPKDLDTLAEAKSTR
jgi:hypothetical protein